VCRPSSPPIQYLEQIGSALQIRFLITATSSFVWRNLGLFHLAKVQRPKLIKGLVAQMVVYEETVFPSA
jgi:hypothetical protein